MLSNIKDSSFTGGTFNAVQGDFHAHTYCEGRKGEHYNALSLVL